MSLLIKGFDGLKINAKGIAMHLVVARFSQKGSQNAQHFVILCSKGIAMHLVVARFSQKGSAALAANPLLHDMFC